MSEEDLASEGPYSDRLTAEDNSYLQATLVGSTPYSPENSIIFQDVDPSDIISGDAHVFQEPEEPLGPQKSSFETPPEPLEFKQSQSRIKPDFLAKTPSLSLQWVFGRDEVLPVTNLVGIFSSHVIYSASNVVVLFDFFNNKQTILQGHRNAIRAIASNPLNLRLFATAESGPGCSIIIWDLLKGVPYKSIPCPHGEECVNYVTFIPGQELLASLGGPNDVTQPQEIILWSLDPEEDTIEPLKTIKVPSNVKTQVEIVFNPENYQFCASTGDSSIVFYSWDKDEEPLTHIPQLPKAHFGKMKGFTTSLWSKNNAGGSWNLMTTTKSGHLIIWDGANREFLKCYRLTTEAITVFVNYKQFFVIGEDRGGVRIFDSKFRILRWTSGHSGMAPVSSISFNGVPAGRDPEFKLKLRERRASNSKVRDYSLGGAKIRRPSEATIARCPLDFPDFVLGFSDGSIGYFHIGEDQLDMILPRSIGPIATMDCMPLTNQIILLNSSGHAQMWDYQERVLLFDKLTFLKGHHKVTCVKFHSSGAFALIGTREGAIYHRRAFTWDTETEPLDTGSGSPVLEIAFSPDGTILAHSDESHALTAYTFNVPRGIWILKGKQRAHFKAILQILFIPDESRLFTLGQDRRLVEYSIGSNVPGQGLTILSVTEVTTSAVPLYMAVDYPFKGPDPYLLFSGTDYKLRYLSLGPLNQGQKVKMTSQGPVYGDPLDRMIEVRPKRANSARFFVFTAGSRIGLAKLPLDGNPYRFSALQGHPGEVKDVRVTSGNDEVMSIGEDDNCAFLWGPNISVLESSVIRGGSGLDPYKDLLGSRTMIDLENCFYYFLLRVVSSQTELYQKEAKIRLEDIPALCRTCGYFPSEAEVALMIEEVTHKRALSDLEAQESGIEVDLEEFIILFANHRPWPLRIHEEIREAFEILGDINGEDVSIPREELRELLTRQGEVINSRDLPQFLPMYFRDFKALNDGLDDEESFERKSMTSSIGFGSGGGDGVSPEDVKLSDFVKLMLPPDASEPLDWSTLPRDDEEDLEESPKERSIQLGRVIDPQVAEEELSRRRNLLKYYSEMIELLKSKKTPMREKLLAVFEMDYLRKNGRLPEVEEEVVEEDSTEKAGVTSGFEGDVEESSELSQNKEKSTNN